MPFFDVKKGLKGLLQANARMDQSYLDEQKKNREMATEHGFATDLETLRNKNALDRQKQADAAAQARIDASEKRADDRQSRRFKRDDDKEQREKDEKGALIKETAIPYLSSLLTRTRKGDREAAKTLNGLGYLQGMSDEQLEEWAGGMNPESAYMHFVNEYMKKNKGMTAKDASRFVGTRLFATKEAKMLDRKTRGMFGKDFSELDDKEMKIIAGVAENYPEYSLAQVFQMMGQGNLPAAEGEEDGRLTGPLRGGQEMQNIQGEKGVRDGMTAAVQKGNLDEFMEGLMQARPDLWKKYFWRKLGPNGKVVTAGSGYQHYMMLKSGQQQQDQKALRAPSDVQEWQEFDWG